MTWSSSASRGSTRLWTGGKRGTSRRRCHLSSGWGWWARITPGTRTAIFSTHRRWARTPSNSNGQESSRGPGVVSRFAEDEARVVATEAEAVGHHVTQAPGARFIGNVVEVAVGIRVFHVDR